MKNNKLPEVEKRYKHRARLYIVTRLHHPPGEPRGKNNQTRKQIEAL